MPEVPEPILSSSLQGNVLAPFNKSYQRLIGLRFGGVVQAKQWLASTVDDVAMHEAVAYFNRAFSLLNAGRKVESDALTAVWRHLSFSYEGLSLLTPDVAGFERAFVQGLYGRAVSELDDPAGADGVHPDGWVVGSKPDNTPHVLVIVAADCADDAVTEGDVIVSSAKKAALTVVYDELGADLEKFDPALKGHEHFGFKDGISQPAIRGRLADGSYFTSRPAGQNNLNLPEFALPGQPLVWPGAFVFGYPMQDPSLLRGSKPAQPLTPSWIADGSYLVFRRLSQRVKAFRDFVATTSTRLAANPVYAGITPARAGALIVGRWASGAPVEVTPIVDDPTMAADNQRNNDFNYLLHPNIDDDGHMCPVFAHVRKVNPRDEPTDKGGQTDTLTRRILRRGIPFGKPLPPGAAADDGVDRGLLFLAYMTSIEQQFELLVSDWMNRGDRPSPQGSGFDLLVGQNGSKPRTRTAEFSSTVISAMNDFIVATGGGYFFSPSIDAIRTKLSV